MKDCLKDLVEHTFDLGCIDLIKIVGDTNTTEVSALAEDLSVVVQAKFHNPVADFVGKQRDFYEVLEERAAEAQKRANHSLVGVDSGITPKEFMEYIKKEEERLNNFSPETILTRQTKAQYQEALHEIANVHIRGERVQLDLKMSPQNIIDYYLHDGLIEQRWNK